jgi:hypothetical protein
MQFTDASVVAGTRRRDDGYLVADVRIARTGIQQYHGSEVGRPDLGVVNVYRPGEEVFSQDTLKSAAHRPVTNDHPADLVDSTNWKQHAVGQTGDEVTGEGIYLRVPLMVSDEATIKAIEGGKREVSAGYVCALDWTPGTTADGQDFDAVQRNIRLNHVAIVARGRAGSEVRIGDGAAPWGASPLPPTADERKPHMADTLRTVMVDGLSVSVTDQGAQAIEKLTADRETARKALSDAQADHAKALAAKDTEIGTLKADLKKAQDAVPQPGDIDKLVADRATLVATVKAIDAKIAVDGKSDVELRRAAVAAKLGDEMVKDASDAEVAGMFKAVARDAKPADPFRATVQGGLKQADGADAARALMVANLSDAWRSDGLKKEAA